MDALYHKVADKWKAIGVLLEIPKGKLASIAEICQRDPHKCLLEMMETWLERIHPPASWETIAEAVDFLGEEQLGKELLFKHSCQTHCNGYVAVTARVLNQPIKYLSAQGQDFLPLCHGSYPLGSFHRCLLCGCVVCWSAQQHCSSSAGYAVLSLLHH